MTDDKCITGFCFAQIERVGIQKHGVSRLGLELRATAGAERNGRCSGENEA